MVKTAVRFVRWVVVVWIGDDGSRLDEEVVGRGSVCAVASHGAASGMICCCEKMMDATICDEIRDGIVETKGRATTVGGCGSGKVLVVACGDALSDFRDGV